MSTIKILLDEKLVVTGELAISEDSKDKLRKFNGVKECKVILGVSSDNEAQPEAIGISITDLLLDM